MSEQIVSIAEHTLFWLIMGFGGIELLRRVLIWWSEREGVK